MDELQAHGVDTIQAVRGRRFRPSRETAERWLPAPPALPWWVPNAYIVALIFLGLGLIAFGVLGRDSNRVRLGDETAGSEPPAQTQSAPPPTQAPVQAGSAGTPAQPDRPLLPPPEAKPPSLDRVFVLDRFAIGVPSGWGRGTGDGAVMFTEPHGDAELRVFLQSGMRKPGAFADDTTAYLRREHASAEVSQPEPLHVSGRPATGLYSGYAGGEQWAAMLSARGYAYLIICTVDEGASKTVEAASVAALRSFRPL